MVTTLNRRFATGLEGFVMLLPWFRRDAEQGAIMGKLRWFQWGYINRYGTQEREGWYILIGLPSYVMQASWSVWHDAPPTMHQRHLAFKEKLPGGNGTWQEIAIECEPLVPLSKTANR